MKQTTALTLLFFLLLSCQQDSSFENFVDIFQPAYKEQFRIPSNQALVIISLEKINQDIAFCKEQLQLLSTFELEKLKPENQEKWQNLSNKLKKKLHQIEVFNKEPDSYNIQPAMQTILDKKDWNLDKKLNLLQQQIKLAPLFYQTAIENLQDVDAKNAKKTWDDHIKTFMFLNQTLPNILSQSDWTRTQKDSFNLHLNAAEVAVKDYIAFCRSTVLNRNDQ